MAESDKKKPTRTAAEGEEPEMLNELETFAQEYDEDNRVFRYGILIAIVFHAVLFVIQFPTMAYQADQDEKKDKIYVVQQVKFKKPPPKQEQKVPEKKKKKVPIPDPTPDEPEPIRTPQEEEPEFDIPDQDIVFDIPEGPPPSEPEGPIMVTGDVKPPEKIRAPSPQYTDMARKARVQGIVIVQAIIDKQGNVTNVKVLKGLPMGLDQAAVNAIKQWRFQPATLNGKPVTVYYNLTVNFQIQ